MENKHQATDRENQQPHHWRSCKLMIDPVLSNGVFKVYRYDGQHFNLPVQDLGVFAVDKVRDPRICRLWTKYDEIDLLVPKFKVDECYVGPVPPKEVTFARLNDNVREGFLTDLCKKYGQIEEVDILYNPQNKKHLGIAKVIFDTVKAAKEAVQHLHQTSVMGNIIHVELDPRGENRRRYFHLLINGHFTPQTVPVGINDVTLQYLADRFLGTKTTLRHEDQISTFTGCISSPTSIATPLSLDTAYSSIWQDTPGSLGQTPQSQGTPRTPHLFGTPLSQDSCYSSQQNTPVYQASQGDHSSYSVHRRSRTEGPGGSCRQPGRYQGRYHRSSQLSSLFQLLQPPPPLPLQSQIHDAADSHRASLPWSQNTHPGQETLSLFPLPHQESPMAFSLERSSAGISNAAPTPVGQRAKTPTLDHHICMADSPPSTPDTSESAVQDMQSHSLDTRIEMILSKNQSSATSLLGDGDLTMAECPAESPVSRPFSLDGTPEISGPPFDVNPHTSRNLEDSSSTPLPDEEEKQATVEEPFTDTPLASRNIPLTLNIRDQTTQSMADQTDVKTRLLPPSWTQVLPSSEDFHLSAPQPLTSYFSGNIPNPISNPKTSALPATHCHTGIMPFNPPILPPRNLPPVPPPILPFPVPLSDGTIPIPPPGFVPVPGQGFPLPPPPLLSPSTVLGPPPPLVAPPPIPPLAYPYPITNQQSDKVVYPPQRSILVPFSALPWPPRFDPTVPPPGYLSPRKDSHKVTVDKVISVIIDELKSIMRKDITRKMVEGVAFRAFDEWWENQEQKAKTAVMPGKGEERAEGRTHPKDPLTLISGLRKTVQLPSFKVKKKRLVDTGEDPKPEVGLSAPEWDGHGVTGEAQEGGMAGVTPDQASLSRGGSSAVKRRHARPLELDSEGEEEEEDEEEEHKEEQSEENNVGVAVSPDNQTSDEGDDVDQNQDNRLDGDELEATGEEVSTEDDKRSLSELESSSTSYSSSNFSSEDSESFSDSSESFSSGYSDESPDSTDEEEQEGDDDEEEEGSQERAWEHSRVECVVISSDEEMELDAPPTPTAPLTPGTELEVELAQLGGSHEGVERDLVEALLGDTNSLFLADPMMDHLLDEHQHPLHSPCTVGLPVVCSDSEVEPDSPAWEMESPDTLRPLTPTGSLGDSDLDILFKRKLTPPAAVEVELPHTPGRGVASSLDSEEDFMDQLLYLSNADPKERAVAVSYAPYEDMPRTPGAEERSVWNRHNSVRVPKTPGRETTPSDGSLVMSPPPPLPRSPFHLPSLSSCLYTPRTPGRDITPPRKPHRHLRTLDTPTTGPSPHSHTPALSSLVYEERLTVSPVVSPPPCSLSSAESPGSWPGPGARGQVPLQGLENRPDLVDDREKGKLFWRRIRQRRRQKRRRWRRMQRWGRTWSPSRETPSLCPALSHHRRAPGGEREVLHRVWREGLDEEDCRLLQAAYKRQLERDNVPWLTVTRWVPHPLTRDLTEEVEEGCDWLRTHVTGSARSEGFYKIDKKDKINYLNRTRLATPSRPTNTQPQASLRSGSDFRSEQRRLLASFSCDSDLVKFNQLKFRKKKIRFCRSHIHDWGLFALEPIAADEMVIEYVGQTIRQLIADMREKRYEDEGIGSSYLFRVDEDYILDATKCGNLARFINHSCNPNCYAKIITVDSQKKIVIYSRQPISINEEITYDYKFPIEDEKIPCLCEAENCRGSLN